MRRPAKRGLAAQGGCPKGDPGPDFGPDSGYSPQLASVANQTIIGGADVPFSGPSNLGSNISHTGGATTSTVGSSGRYRLFWAASNTVGVGSALAVAVNGTVAAGTTIPVLTATGHLSGEAIVQLAAGDAITVRNNSAVPMTLALSTSVGASLTIQRIA